MKALLASSPVTSQVLKVKAAVRVSGSGSQGMFSAGSSTGSVMTFRYDLSDTVSFSDRHDIITPIV
jgi:hypothetical protein